MYQILGQLEGNTFLRLNPKITKILIVNKGKSLQK